MKIDARMPTHVADVQEGFFDERREDFEADYELESAQ